MGADGLRARGRERRAQRELPRRRGSQAHYDAAAARASACTSSCSPRGRQKERRGQRAGRRQAAARLRLPRADDLLPADRDEALMIEPTETEVEETLDAFCDAMIRIAREAEENPCRNPRGARHDARCGACDQTRAARERAQAARAGALAGWGSCRDSDWRLLVTEPADGATNMAIDEALWRGRQAGTSPPTLRFFAWAPPTVSLGYGQPLDRHVDLVACRALGVGLVRRPDRRQRDLSRRPRARADLQRGRDRRGPRGDRGSAGDLPLDRRRAPARPERARAPARSWCRDRAPTARFPRSASPAPGASRSRSAVARSWAARSGGRARASCSTARCCSASTDRVCARCFRPRAIRWRR